MYSFSYLEPVCCSMSSSNCCFLTCVQISQEAGQVLWYSHLFQNFPQFVGPLAVRLRRQPALRPVDPRVAQQRGEGAGGDVLEDRVVQQAPLAGRGGVAAVRQPAASRGG